MSQKAHPYGYRVGITKPWRSRWISLKRGSYVNNLKFDTFVRSFLEKELRDKPVSHIEIEKDDKAVRILIKTSRPGLIIGPKGELIADMKKRMLRFLKRNDVPVGQKHINMDVHQIPNPESDAKIVATQIRQSLERRLPFRRVMKQVAERTMSSYGVEGVRIVLSGRLGGAEMARKEEVKMGSIPLQTIRADIDFAKERAEMTYGTIGVSVWIYRGEKNVANDNNK